MDDLKRAAMIFQGLLNVKYKIILGKKRKLTEFYIDFQKEDFFHLIGLQYLKDLPYLRKSRDIVFDKIINGEITLTDISKSYFYEAITQRIQDFLLFETLLDSNDIAFKYAKNRSTFSNISAEYLLLTSYEGRTNYIFIDQFTNRVCKGCRSFFFNDINDYCKNQVRMTLLYKEKIYVNDKKSVIQFDRLHKS